MASVEGPSRADTQPDVMNDPAYATNIESKNKALDEPDTCRICRGEGSKQDPLFYPCKCSGSIKFVHQNCLMEWLSHSQKKHCELCKTPFRFTKLYHPQMPPTLPAPIFLRQALIHSLRSLVTWSRLVLVIFVWLGWLPWTMRAVWRGLFWLADGGWADIHRLDPGTALAAQHRPADLVSNATSPAGQALPLSKEAAASALVSGMANIISPILSHISRALNFTAGEPTFYGFAKGVFSTSFHRLANSIVPSSLYTASGISNNTNPDQKHPSWLSNVKMLKTLTRSQFLNDLLIDTLEGQLITLLVVIAFVLVFLIREWVVQQQPGANMGAGFNAAVAERQARENVPLQQPANPNEQPGLEQQGRPNDAEPDDDQDNRARVVDGVGVLRPRAMARPRNRRRLQAPPAEGRAQPDDHSVGFPDQSSRAPIADDETAIFGNKLPEGEVFHFGSSSEGQKLSGRQRPVMRTRSAFARAVEIQRTIDEEKRASGNQDWPGLEVFMDLWQRADSKPEKVLNIIEAEHRTAELGWIVSAMKRLQNVDSLPELPNEDSTLAPDNEVFEDEHISDGSSQSWQDVSRPTDGDAAVTPLPGIGSSDVAPVVENSREERELSPGNEVLDTQTSRAESPNAVGHWVDKGKGRATEAPDLTDSVAPLEDLTKKRTDDEFPRLRRSVNRIGRIEPITALPTTLSDDPGDDVITEEPSGSEGKMSEQLSVSEKSKEHLTGAPIEESGHPEPQDGRDADLTPDGNLPDIQEDSQPHLQSNHLVANDAPAASQNLTDKVMAWLWGGITTPGLEQDRREEMIDENDERLVQDFADEAPFVPVFNGHHAAQVDLAEGQLAEGPELGAAEAEAGPDPNDQDAIDEGEDLEGVMELIGMQGPLTGLVQNAMFSAVLISTTVAAGIWLPYIWGKFVLLLLANPITMMIRLPLRWLSFTADSIVDVCIIFGSCLIYWIAIVFQTCLIPLGMVFPIIAQFTHHSSLAAAARSVAEGGLERLAKMVIATSSGFSETEFPIFSIVSHEALHTLETHIGNGFKICFYFIPKTIQSLVLQALHNSNLNDSPKTTLFATASRLSILALGNASDIVRYMRLILKANPSSISLEYPRRTLPLDYSLAYWNSKDRFITIILGYAFFAIAGFIYLRISGSFGKAQHGERVAGFVAEILQQAGGVVKVILIISIEMIVFPLYCGLLLDVALLPLFANVTLMSRVSFTADSPSTSLFVHWFVGTCYMFHFALFVSMCRKIMRSGVLYFIRDPDDPTFHPVRDVLERNVSTQLRKIAFSALVYGALVIICLGGVVWGLFYACEGVLPIHWSSNEPVLEFPVDLLFYNFLMPLAVKFFKPSDGLHSMYSWWFRKCARSLRLTHFLFGERKEDEEGRHIRRTWWDMAAGKWGNVQSPVIGRDRRILAEDRNVDAYFLRDGTYVRAPASDQVRIPKGGKTFLEVNDENERVDGQPDREDGLHGKQSTMFTKVYIPPLFKLRIGLFMLLIWLFAAMTGVGITIVPLVFGRVVFAYLLPTHVRMNDVYAFSIGIYILGGALYCMLRVRIALDGARFAHLFPRAPRNQVLREAYSFMLRFVRVFYTYVGFALVLPSLSALIMEFYIIIPLHTYFGGGERHIIYFIQDWTLGVLYIKMLGRLILWNPTSRPAQALRAVVRQGWLNPDVGLATRGFIFPASVLMVSGLLLPLSLGWTANMTYFQSAGNAKQSHVYRYSYPAVFALGMWVGCVYLLCLALKGWRQRIRDEVYLVGERLHNFGEKRAGAGGASLRVTTRGQL